MDYFGWNAAIAQTIFTPDVSGRRILFYIAQSTLADIGEPFGCAYQDFLAAIEAGPPGFGEENVCEKALRCSLNWRRRKYSWPPYLGYLAFFVLAAGLDGDFAPNAYYPRLRKLLGEAPITGTYPGFTEIHKLWEDLQLWSVREQRGRLGLFEIHVPGRLVHVGIPISQVILTEQERLTLPFIFADAGIDHRTVPSDLFLRQCLLRYGAPHLRSRTLRVLRDWSRATEESALIVSAVLDELEQWDGSVPGQNPQQPGSSQRCGSVRICCAEIDLVSGRVSAQLRCRAKEEFPVDGLDLVSGQDKYSCEEYGGGWSTPLMSGGRDTEIDAGELDWSQGICLLGHDRRWRFQMLASRARVFTSGAADGIPGYVEIQHLPRSEEFIIAVDVHFAALIETWGRKSCIGFRRIRVSQGVPTGWQFYAAEAAHDDTLIRNKFPQLAFPKTTQILLSGGIRDSDGAFFPFALPKVSVLGAPLSARIFLNDRDLGPATDKGLQLEVLEGGDLEFDVEVREESTSLRRRTLYVRAEEQKNLFITCWLDRLGLRVADTSIERVSGSQVVSTSLDSFADWIGESVFTSRPPADTEALEPEHNEPLRCKPCEISYEHAVGLLREWKAEISSPTETTFTSELARSSGGIALCEGAWHYRQAVIQDDQPHFSRAIKELRTAILCGDSVVKAIAHVILQLALMRTGRPLASAPLEVPPFAGRLIHRLAGLNVAEHPESTLSLDVSDISPIKEDSDFVSLQFETMQKGN